MCRRVVSHQPLATSRKILKKENKKTNQPTNQKPIVPSSTTNQSTNQSGNSNSDRVFVVFFFGRECRCLSFFFLFFRPHFLLSFAFRELVEASCVSLSWPLCSDVPNTATRVDSMETIRSSSWKKPPSNRFQCPVERQHTHTHTHTQKQTNKPPTNPKSAR